jgi:ABC-2 type transport system permease protein
MQANPVIVKELRGRMRGWRASVVLTIYLLVISLLTLLFYWMLQATAGFGPQAPQVGKFMFFGTVVFQTVMVALLTPAFTAGSITSEREQKTYDLLMTTLLPARSIIFGKLGSALAYVMLLILSVAPLASLAFMFGGISPEEIVLSQVAVFAAAMLYASVGIFWSSALRTSVASNVLTYGTIIFQMLILPFLYLTITSLMGAYSYNPGGRSMIETPEFWYVSGVVLSFHPLIAMGMSETFITQGDPLFIYTSTTKLNGETLLVVSPWLLFCIEAVLVSAILVLLSIRLVQPVRYKSRGRGSVAVAAYQPVLAAPQPQVASISPEVAPQAVRVAEPPLPPLPPPPAPPTGGA